MSTQMIRLQNREDVQTVCSVIKKYHFPMEFISGENKVDARSPMGLFTLDFTRPIALTAYTEDDAALFEELKPFITQKTE